MSINSISTAMFLPQPLRPPGQADQAQGIAGASQLGNLQNANASTPSFSQMLDSVFSKK